MEIVIIFATITSFFSHFMIERAMLANAVSVITATLLTLLLVWTQQNRFEAGFLRDLSITVLSALVVSVLVGLVFNAHRRCSK